MAIFATFIRPSPSGAGFSHWSRRVAFGERLPSGRHSGFVHLEVDDPAEGKLFAAFAGTLSAQRPTGFLQPSGQQNTERAVDSTLTLYLTPTAGKVNPEWQAVCRAIANRFIAVADPAYIADAIGYLEYRNVDVEKAKSLLSGRLKSRPNLGPEERWKKFLACDGAVSVQSGEEFGAAGHPYLTNTPNSHFQIAIGLHTRYGMFDPGAWYKDMTTSPGVTAPPGADTLVAQLLPPQSVLIDATRSVDSAGADRLWPWSALLQYKQAKNLVYGDWRKLGNLQKSLYRAQLLARVRPALAPANTPRFDYDVDDMSNVFQLEAVTEFYINLPNPWDAATNPVAPDRPEYRTINLLALYGSAAQTANLEVTLDGELDMTRVMPGRDTLLLEAENARPSKQFRIMAVDRANQKVTLDFAPSVGGPGTWCIFHNPTLVMIDAFGARVGGARALADGTQAVPKLKLEALTDAQMDELKRVNPYETVSLFDVAPGAICEARILKTPLIDRRNRIATLELDRALTPVLNDSAWSIPAGVGGAQGYIAKPNSPASQQWGWDNYDGMMFMIAGGEVRCFFPFTSYTSRSTIFRNKNVGAKFHSSIKGNRLYRFGSVFSRNDYINLSFSVIDPEGLVWGDRMDSLDVQGQGRVLIRPDVNLGSTLVAKYQNIYFVQPKPPRFSVASIADVRSDTLLKIGKQFSGAVPLNPSPYWIAVYDGTRENRFYYKPGFDSDSVPDGKPAPYGETEAGKGGIRIHLGETGSGSGSHGCQVSPHFMRLRMAMIAYHQEANATYYLENKDHPKLDRVPKMYTEARKPELVKEYLNLIGKLQTLQNDLKLILADPLYNAVDAALRAGNPDESLHVLRLALQDFEDRAQAAEDVADPASEKEILPVLETLTDLVVSEDVSTALEWARENAERVSRLKQEIKDLGISIKDELESWGWNDAMHGDYWVIRPDERAV